MRRLSALLVLATACHHGDVVVHVDDVAASAGRLNASGRATMPAMAQRYSPSWSKTTTTIRGDQRVTLNLVENGGDDELYMRHRLVTPTFDELLADCPQTPFSIDAATKAAYPRCKLLAVSEPTIDVGRTRFPGPALWGFLGGATGVGIVACATKCDSPFSEVSTGVTVVGGVLAVAGLVAIVSLLSAR